MIEKSILVVAHPDDEVLWFSSILERVDRVVFCYLDCESIPLCSEGRRKSLSEYPIKNIFWANIDESGVFNDNNWHNPETNEYGLKIFKKGLSEKRYRENYSELKQGLSRKLKSYDNVFTHNPWGEYGNEEHIQVYRVVKELQEQMEFDLWFSNYCSNKSFKLMLRYLPGFDVEYVTQRTNKVLSHSIERIYKKNGCWTWYDNWEWFDNETFIKDKRTEVKDENYGRAFPLNMIKVEFAEKSKIKSSVLRRFSGKLLGQLKAFKEKI